jgi:non-heme chloroperoxidase
MSFLTTPEGVRLRFTDRGEGEQTIVLIHGWKGSHRKWDPAIHRLAKDFRVVAFDTRGMGESDKPGGRYDFEVLADDLAFVLQELDAREVTLVGWSMGCSISLEYLARGGDRAARLVLINGPIRLQQSPDFPWAMPPEQLAGYMESLAKGWPEAEREFAQGALRDPDSAYADLYYRIALQMPLEMSIRIVEEQAKLDHAPVLASLEIPVLAIYGGHDPYYPRELAQYIAQRAKDGRHVIFEESAHAVHMDEPDLFQQVISDFTRGQL